MDPNEHFMIIYVIYEKAYHGSLPEGSSKLIEQDAEGRRQSGVGKKTSYKTIAGYFGRWQPFGVYVTGVEEGGPIELSSVKLTEEFGGPGGIPATYEGLFLDLRIASTSY